MTENLVNPNEAWRNYSRKMLIPACKLEVDDLKKIYHIINEKQIEHGKIATKGFFKLPEETQEQFQQRLTNAINAFITTVTLTDNTGNVRMGHGQNIFDESLFPENIASILYDTSFSPQAQLKYTPTDRVTVLLDFSKPALINYASLPSAPTPNNSNILISAANETWATALYAKLNDVFRNRSRAVDWLHNAGAYDILLLLIGLPLSLLEANRIGNYLTSNYNFSSAMTTAIYVYIFFIMLNIFRSIFSYSRWVFPKIELETKNSKLTHQRVIFGTLMLGVAANAIWNLLNRQF